MSGYKIGDIVARKSYGADVIFRITDIEKEGKQIKYIMKGINYRIIADANEGDLVLQNKENLRQEGMRFAPAIDKITRQNNTSIGKRIIRNALCREKPGTKSVQLLLPGKVLHLDGDEEYLNTCMEKYKEMEIDAVGKYIPEKEQAAKIKELLQEYEPDILVITGHDSVSKGKEGYSDINNYRNSKHFIEAVKEARKHRPSIDGLIIFAGACQSHYQMLIYAGANFASSPQRELIHTLDPVFVCQKLAYAPISKIVIPKEVISNTITGEKGIGGIETRGTYREGFPCDLYDVEL